MNQVSTQQIPPVGGFGGPTLEVGRPDPKTNLVSMGLSGIRPGATLEISQYAVGDVLDALGLSNMRAVRQSAERWRHVAQRNHREVQRLMDERDRYLRILQRVRDRVEASPSAFLKAEFARLVDEEAEDEPLPLPDKPGSHIQIWVGGSSWRDAVLSFGGRWHDDQGHLWLPNEIGSHWRYAPAEESGDKVDA